MINRKLLFRELDRRKKSEPGNLIRKVRANTLKRDALTDRMGKNYDSELAKRLEKKAKKNGSIGNILTLFNPSHMIKGVQKDLNDRLNDFLPSNHIECIERSRDGLKDKYLKNAGEVCEALDCVPAHVRDIDANYKILIADMEAYYNGELAMLPRSKSEMKEFMEITNNTARISMIALAQYMHVKVLTMALEFDMLSEFRKLAKSEIVSLVNKRAHDWNDDIKRVRSELNEDKLSRLLSITLHPKDADRIISTCTVKTVPVETADPLTELVEKINRIIPAKKSEVRLFNDVFGDDYEKIASAIKFKKEGLSANIAIYSVKNELTVKEAKLLSVAEPHLETLEMDLDRAYNVLCCLDGDLFSNAFKDGGMKINDWLSVMAPTQDFRYSLAILLSNVCEAPENREELAEVLEENDDEIIDAILDNNKCLDDFEKSYKIFTDYAHRFVKEGSIDIETIDEEEENSGDHDFERPHESLEFSQMAEQAMVDDGIDPEDLRIVFAYGLKLSSRSKGAIGHKYLPSNAFMANIARVLDPEGNHIPARRKKCENFLKKHGIIYYYKEGEVVALNTRKDNLAKPDDLGEDIIGSVLRWRREFQQETS